MKVAEAAFALYVDYVGIKLHFNGEMVWKPNVLTERFNPDQLAKRADWRIFVRVCEERGLDRIENRTAVVTLLHENPKAWIGGLLGEDFRRQHLARIQRLRRLDETFLSDLITIQREAERLDKEFLDLVCIGDPPYIIKLLTREGGITPETAALIHHATGFAEIKTSHPLWERKRMACSRYAHLLASYIDLEQVKEFVCNTVTTNLA
jgi:hypothetical protein